MDTLEESGTKKSLPEIANAQSLFYGQGFKKCLCKIKSGGMISNYKCYPNWNCSNK